MRIEDRAAELAQIDRLLGEIQTRLRALGRAAPQQNAIGSLRQLADMRALRERCFGGGLFADPAWDILLELAVLRAEGRPIPISTLSTAIGVPATTTLRWIGILVDRGLIDRVPDPHDRRRVYVMLSEEGARRMAAFAESAALR